MPINLFNFTLIFCTLHQKKSTTKTQTVNVVNMVGILLKYLFELFGICHFLSDLLRMNYFQFVLF